jgi:hypothetical protein
MSLTRRIALCVALVLALAAAASQYYTSRWAAPDCTSEDVMHRMGTALREHDQLDSIFVNNIRAVSGNWFSATRDCAAEVTSIRGDVAAANLPWREVRYRIEAGDGEGKDTVAVTLGGAVPLAAPEPTWWESFLALF